MRRSVSDLFHRKDSYLNMEQIISATMITVRMPYIRDLVLSENSRNCVRPATHFYRSDSDIVPENAIKAVARQTMVMLVSHAMKDRRRLLM